MHKTYKFDEMSGLTCRTNGCNALIKREIVNRKHHSKPLICFKCHQKAQAKTENPCNTAREVKTGKVMGRKKGKYVNG